MLNALQSYQFGAVPLRVVLCAGEPWFVANDVCASLGLKNPQQAISALDDDEKGGHIMDTLGGAQEMNIVSESGLYSLIFRSRKPEARIFRKWVTSEVLPSIRRTGSFSLAGTDGAKGLMAAVKVVAEARRLYGAAGAREVWAGLGLPAPSTATEPDLDNDPLLQSVSDALAGRKEATIAEVVEAGDMEDGQEQRRHVARLMRHLGWSDRAVRRGDKVVRLFTPSEEA